MKTYYIDLMEGSGDGLTPESPRKEYRDLILVPGDKVLFKCNTRVYGRLDPAGGTAEEPITYGAYGEGEKPVFCGCINVSEKENWTFLGNNIWRCEKAVPLETCNIIFNDGEFCGTMKWKPQELEKSGEWYDSRVGTHECVMEQPKAEEEQTLLLYCEKNPAEYYNKIECATREYRELAHLTSNVVIENLVFEKNGVHGLAGRGENIVINNCVIRLIGGCVWNKVMKIRFGNGVEFWDVSRNVSVINNHFCDIYDSGVTHQGSVNCQVTENAHFDNNVFVKCGMGAYEGRDLVPRNLTFNQNVCMDAGEGFSKNGVTMPRNSEIWPQPMGHHVFIWRMEQPTENGYLQIHNNVFHNAPYGAAIYSLAVKDAEAQFDIDNNIYYAENNKLLNHINGRDYENFEEYRTDTGYDKNGQYRKGTI